MDCAYLSGFVHDDVTNEFGQNISFGMLLFQVVTLRCYFRFDNL